MEDGSALRKSNSEHLSFLASQLQHAREQRGLTLETLAHLSGVSAGLLSQLERGVGNPSFVTLLKISKGLGIPLSLFFEGVDRVTSPVVRKHERRRLDRASKNIIFESLTPDVNRSLAFMWLEFLPMRPKPKLDSHEGEEYGIVIQGCLEIYIADEVHVLKEGDSISFYSNLPHAYHNPGQHSTFAVWAIMPSAGLRSEGNQLAY